MQTKAPRKKASTGDWHRADIKAALEKAGWSLRQLSIQHGLSDGTLRKALLHPYPRGEYLIAQAIGTRAEKIWPTRYHRDGTPRSGNWTPPHCTSRATAEESAA